MCDPTLRLQEGTTSTTCATSRQPLSPLNCTRSSRIQPIPLPWQLRGDRETQLTARQLLMHGNLSYRRELRGECTDIDAVTQVPQGYVYSDIS